MKRKYLKAVLPVVVVLVGVLIAVGLIRSRPVLQTRAAEVTPPLVRVLRVQPESVQLMVHSQGTVVPRTETDLVPQVSGRVLTTAASFVEGGFFDAGDVLITVDPTDFELAVVSARAQVAQAEVRLAREEAEGRVARREWEQLGEGEGAPLVKREPQLLESRAALAAAAAALQQAKVNLQRTQLVAPFAGRVRAKHVDAGQFVSVGQRLGRIYATDFAEVRVPLPDDQLAFVDLPLIYRDDHETAARKDANGSLHARDTAFPEAILRARFAGRWHEWRGHVVRTEGEIDPQSRMVHAVVQVRDPYARGDDPNRPPLAAGLFVETQILGHRVDNVFVLPRAAMRGRDQLLIVDDENRLRFRSVEVLRAEREQVIVRAGLRAGERVCLSPLAAVTDGMRVRAADDDIESPTPLERTLPETPVGRSGDASGLDGDHANGVRLAETRR